MRPKTKEPDGSAGDNPLATITPITLRQSSSGHQEIYEYLRELILNGEMAPGTIISQVALAKALGVSRTPLREAIRLLQQEGLIEAEHNRRARVVSFDPDDLEAVYCNRLLLESLGIGVTVPRLTSNEVAEIDGLLGRMRSSVESGDQSTYEVAHREFHRAIIMHGGAPLLSQISLYADRGRRYRVLYRFNVEGADEFGASEHTAIFEACRDHDQKQAVTALARHLSHTALGILGRMAPERDPVALRTALLVVTGQLPSADH